MQLTYMRGFFKCGIKNRIFMILCHPWQFGVPARIMVQSFAKLIDIHDAFTSSQDLKNLPEK